MKSKTPEVQYAEHHFLKQFITYLCSYFTNNMSILGWTWHNLWNLLLTINFNYKYFHNSVDWSRLYFKCISLYDCQKVQDCIATVFRLLENAFVKLPHSSHDLIINPPCRRVPKNVSPTCHEKYLEKGSSMFLKE